MAHLVSDRLGELLREHEHLYGVLCRDATLTDIELMAQAGYHLVWLDLEHCPQSISELIRLTRSIEHLGMVPLVRIPELLRTNVQPLLDGGVRIVTLPDVRTVEQAARLVQLGKFPPLGQRGVSSTGAGTGFQLGPDSLETLRQADRTVRMMVMFESDEGYGNLEEIVGLDGIDMVSVGPGDWATGLGLSGREAKEYLAPRIERILRVTRDAGKISVMSASGPADARYYSDRGVRIFIVGVDVAMKRMALVKTLRRFQNGEV